MKSIQNKIKGTVARDILIFSFWILKRGDTQPHSEKTADFVSEIFVLYKKMFVTKTRKHFVVVKNMHFIAV